MTMTPERLQTLAQEAADEFDELCKHRHALGEKKYGAGKFLTVDTLEEALFELSDLSNYAKYTFIRVRLLQAQLEGINEGVLVEDFTKDLPEAPQ
jgi:hypothetical protein